MSYFQLCPHTICPGNQNWFFVTCGELKATTKATQSDADVAAAAAQVRALMFVARFRQDIDQRLAALEH